MKIDFKNLPNNEMTYMGITSDIVKSIYVDDIPVGVVYLSEMNAENSIYVEYIEFLSVFQCKHLLRPVLKALSSEYGTLEFESQPDLYKKYEAAGAIHTDYDEDREMYYWKYVA